MSATAIDKAPMGSILDEAKAKIALNPTMDNWINGKAVPAKSGKYFDNASPITGEHLCKVARSDAADVELALDAAHAAFESWGVMARAERARILNKIADAVEDNLERLAIAETLDMGKPLREAMAADIPMVVDHFRYFAAACLTEDSPISEVDKDTIAYHFLEPIGVIGAIIPWNFPLVLAAWKMAPALAAGNCIIVKPAEQTPVSIMIFMEIIADILPKGVINVVHGFGQEAGQALATSKRIGKLTFTGETSTGKLIMKFAAENIVPVTLELGGKSPNIFFPDIWEKDDALRDKALEGFTMFALNKGEVCTSPTRALVHESMYDEFIETAVKRAEKIIVGNPLELETMMGPQASVEHYQKVLSYFDIGKNEGAKVLTGAQKPKFGNALDQGCFLKPTIFEGTNDMRVFQEEIFGPILSVTKFTDFDDAMRIANDTQYGLTAGVWTRDINVAYRAARALKAGRIWTNTYHMYPTHAAFGGYKQSGIGRENHRMMLANFQQTKNVLVSYDENPRGFF
jgi:aldehyde dehydrogenase